MPSVIRIRDVIRDKVLELGPAEPVLRGPYELFNPTGPVRVRGAVIEWVQGAAPRSGRAAPATLGDTRPGERVLVRLPPLGAEDEWWLCEIESVDGIAAA